MSQLDSTMLRWQRQELLDLGIDVIPLKPADKPPIFSDWQILTPAEQWRDAPADANIGIRGGGLAHTAVIDCDAWPTFETARRYLAGLGYDPDGDYPIVSTLHEGRRHVYVSLMDALPGHWRILRPDFGDGELRYGPGSYVVGAGSVVEGKRYELLAGDFRQLPRLERADLTPIINLDETPILVTPTEMINLPRHARMLLAGRGVERFHSRSEAEYSLIVTLVNAGCDWGGVIELFLTHPGPGKFQELRQRRGEREALRYLRHSYDSAAGWSREHESSGRKAARSAYTWAIKRPWPGRTGNSDRAVFLAHTRLAYQAGRLDYGASVRDLAEGAGVAIQTAYNANRRLIESGLLKVAKAHRDVLATRYSIADAGSVVSTLPQGCPGWGSVLTTLPSHDAFRFRGLGKSAAQILDVLAEHPGLTALELAEATGRCIGTVRKQLRDMSVGKRDPATGERRPMVNTETGEVLRLVERDGDGWRVVEGVDLDAIARFLETAGAAEKQARQHAAQRDGYRRATERARAGDTPKRVTSAGERATMERARYLAESRAIRTPGRPDDSEVLAVLRDGNSRAYTVEELARCIDMPEGELVAKLDALWATGKVDRIPDAQTRYTPGELVN